MIKKIVLENFKQFRKTEINCKPGKNIFVGENGAGKTTLLQALGLVLSGSHAQIEKDGIASLFNVDAVYEFLNNRNIEAFPELIVEIYFEDNVSELPRAFDIEGKHNSKKEKELGILLIIKQNEEYSEEISRALEDSDWQVFPFEYYKVEFMTFSGRHYTNYTRPFRFIHTIIDTSLVNSKHEIQKRIEEVYLENIPAEKRSQVNHIYRDYNTKCLNDIKEQSLIIEPQSEYTLSFNGTENSFREAISISKNNIDVKNLGQGEKVLLSIENAHKNIRENVKVILIEEPENHLSYLNMQKLINTLSIDTETQVFISTHSNMIATRLGVENIIFVHEGQVSTFDNVDAETIDFFKKSTNQNLLNFMQSDKVILVEGNAEYILMDYFYRKICSSRPEKDGVSIISADGLSFKRYLNIARGLSSKKIVVITDNDRDYDQNVNKKYAEYEDCSNIRVYSDDDHNNYTFEICLNNENKEFIESLKLTSSTDVIKFMLREKAEFALRLLEKLEQLSQEDRETFRVPKYIEEAIKWIKD